ncbi:hypothetical protein Q672_14355 [Marinobacter sp. EVN1]|nr:hypothetical protein Q673_05715 [Marinobacter sp. EN3]ERS86397.1 hypothetical protein Q672_14355 [Marinobacter sp. EVN1]ERS87225.1 hypothetical protein Q667_02195 [Marinobacter sp. C1S70]MAP32534.1 hypothetical protein [Marinobacter sp.]HCP21921.1 hypothetical protein [Marinobacter nauticus]
MTDKWQFVTFIKTDQKLIIVTLISVSELVQPASLRGWYLLEAALCAAFFMNAFRQSCYTSTMHAAFLILQ